MKIEFLLRGLDCANCATKIERKLQKIKEIQSVTVNFMTTKLSITLQDTSDPDPILASISKIIKDIDSNVVLERKHV